MLRNPTLISVQVSVLSLSLALASGGAVALGLGGMRTQSALNQPFYAEIDLFDIKSDELDTVKVRLASREDFSQAGAERPHFLTRLNFTPMIGPSGQPIVQLTSREPIREPYLDFLVEVLWPQGRLVKEYTVLMDPPVSGGPAAPRVTQPRVAAPVRRSPPQPVRRAERPDPPPQRSASRPASDQQPAAPARPAPAAAPTVAKPPPVARQAAASFPLRYGPVTSGSGLWKVARRMALPDATLAQTAMALYRNNQDAFVGGNINLLKVGADLVIPSAGELFALDADSAEKQFQDALAGRSVTSKPIIATPEQPELRIATAAAEDGAQAPSSEDDADPGAPPEKIGELEDDLLLVRETSETNRQETTELRDRIRELEDQLGDIRRLLELRNEQLAQLQLAGRDPVTAGAAGPDLPDLPESGGMERGAVGNFPDLAAAPSAPLLASEPEGDDVGRELLPNRSSDTDGGVPEDPSDPIEQAEVLAEAVSVVGTEAGPVALEAPAETTTGTVAEVPDAAQEPSATDSDLFSFLEPVTDGVPPWALASGLGAVMMGGLGLLAYRRRRGMADLGPDDMGFDFDPAEDEFQQSGELVKPTAHVAKKPESGTDPEFGSGVQSVRSPEDGSPSDVFPSEETLSIDLDSLPESELDIGPSPPLAESGSAVDIATGLPPNVQRTESPVNPATQETDVVAEAEIYILYGRYREAESILLDELEHSPSRVDLRYKLAEAYIGGENRDALTALMKEMESAGEDRDDPARWFTMRQELARMRPPSDADDRSPAEGNASAPGPLVAEPPVAQPPVAEPSVTESSMAEPETEEMTDDLDANDGDRLGIVDLDETEDAGLDFSAREVEPSPADELREQMEELELDLRDLDMLGDLRADAPSVTAQPPADAGVAPTLELPPSEAAVRSAPSVRDVPMQLGDDLDLDLDALDQLASVDHRDAAPDSPMPELDGLDDGLGIDATETPRPDVPLEPASKSVPIPMTESALEPELKSTPTPIAQAPLEPELKSAPVPNAEAPLEALSADDSDPNADNIPSDMMSSQWQMDSGLWDEAATKMDLARAYIEMEDPDAARTILTEVLVEGNDEQQGEANTLLAKLG